MRAREKGFTVVEFFIVVVILSILGAIIVPRFFPGPSSRDKKGLQAKEAQVELKKEEKKSDLGGAKK